MSFNLQLVVSHNFDFGDCIFYKERILECAMRAANANNGVIAAGIHPAPAAGHRWGTSIYHSTLDNLDSNKSLQFLQPVMLTYRFGYVFLLRLFNFHMTKANTGTSIWKHDTRDISHAGWRNPNLNKENCSFRLS